MSQKLVKSTIFMVLLSSSWTQWFPFHWGQWYRIKLLHTEYKNLKLLRLKLFIKRQDTEFHKLWLLHAPQFIVDTFQISEEQTKVTESVMQAPEKYKFTGLNYTAQLLKNSSSQALPQMRPFSLHVWSQITLEVSHNAEEPQKIIKVFCEILLSLWDKPGALTCIARGLF